MTKRILLLIAIALLLPMPVSSAERDYAIFSSGIEQENKLQLFEAMDRFREAIALAPDNSGYIEHYAWLLSSHDFAEEAVDVLSRLLPMSPEKKNIYRGIGWNQKVLGRYEAALDAYQQVFQLTSPRQPYKPVFKEISLKLYRHNELQVADLQARLALKPDDTSLAKELCQAYLNQGNLANALAVGQPLAARTPDDLSFRLTLARAQLWKGDHAQGEAELKRLLELSGDSAYVWYLLGREYAATGNLAAARQALERSLAIYPQAPVVRKELAELLARLGKSKDSVTMARTIDAKFPHRLTAKLAQAHSFHFSGKLAEARELYRGILVDYPANSDALWGMTETSIYGGRYADAGEALEQWEQVSYDPRIAAQKKLLHSFIAPRLAIKGGYYGNSADFSRWDGGTEAALYRFGTTLTTAYVFTRFNQKNFPSIDRHGLGLEGEKRFGELVRAGAHAGVNFYDNGRTSPNGRFSLFFEPVKDTDLALNVERNDIIDTELPFRNAIYNYVVTMGAVGNLVKTWDYSLFVRTAPTPWLHLSGKALYGDYSDGNSKLSLMADVEFTFTSAPALSGGYNYFYLDYRKPAPNYQEGAFSTSAYYDPSNLEVHTVFFRIAHDLNQQLRCGLEDRVSFIPKSDGVANSVFAYLLFAAGDHDSIGIDGRYFYQNKGVARNGAGGRFHAEQAVLTYSHQF